ncbi:S-layer homology domain-containing protein [Paenibacillus anaericanus]|uniref:S-layer homology domain-containing protein n=1 Tax=Paenibacillus anaericanus TaxID=170367 RepID=UPI0035219FB9
MKDISGHWAESAIIAGVAAGYVTGYSDQSFKPDASINRAEFITMLGRALPMKETTISLTFTDSKNIPAWATSYISQAVEAGIVSGYTDGTFKADKVLNRAEITTWMVRAAELKGDPQQSLSFSDKNSIPVWAVPYVTTAVKEGLVSGVGQNRFAPQQVATRAEAAAFIAKLLKVTTNN